MKIHTVGHDANSCLLMILVAAISRWRDVQALIAERTVVVERLELLIRIYYVLSRILYVFEVAGVKQMLSLLLESTLGLRIVNVVCGVCGFHLIFDGLLN